MRHGGISNDKMPQYMPDYIISWDFSKEDFPCVTVSCVEKDKDMPLLISRFLGRSHEKTGVVSLRQLIEYRDAEDRYEKEREVDMAKLRKAFEKKEEQTSDQRTTESIQSHTLGEGQAAGYAGRTGDDDIQPGDPEAGPSPGRRA